jgi:PKD repeat protein
VSRRYLAALIAAILLFSIPLAVLGRTPTSAPVATSRVTPWRYASVERVIEAGEIGVARPADVVWNAHEGRLLIFDGARPGRGVEATLWASLTNLVVVGGVAPGSHTAFDASRDRIVTLDGTGAFARIASTAGAGTNAAVGATLALRGHGVTSVRGIAAQGGSLLVLDDTGHALYRIPSDIAGTYDPAAAKRIDVSALGSDLSGLAVDGATGHVFVFARPGTLWELDANGVAVARRNLSRVGLDDVRGITIAPTADTTDAPGRKAAYLADAGRVQNGTVIGAGVYEVALTAPGMSPLAAAAVSSVTLVNTINTGAGSSNWTPDSPDPSGLAYIPGTDRLVAADGEVEETTGAGFHNANVWFASRTGATSGTMNTLTSNPSNNEPTGAAYDSARNELYISKDGSNGRVWVYNATTLNLVRSFTVTGAPYNDQDCEGLGFGNGVLYMVDAIDNDLVKVQPGGDGVVGTGNDDVVSNFDLQQYGQSEPEGLDVDPTTGNIWVVSNKVSGGGTPDPMVEVTPNGTLVSSVSIAEANPNSAAGLAMAPPSNGGGGFNIYISDRMVDNNAQPSENDGRIYEFSTGGGGGGNPPVANFTAAQVPGTLQVNFTDTSTNNPDAWSWQFGDPGNNTSNAQNPSFTYPAPGNYQVTLEVSNNDGSDSVTKTVTVTNPSGGGNLMANPGFEIDANGDTRPDSWTTNNAFTRSNAVVHGGSFAGRHFLTNDGGYNVYQTVTGITAGTPYTFSGWLNIPATSDKFTFKVQLKWRNASGKALSTSTILTRKVSTTGWLQVGGNATAPAGAASVRVTMTISSLNGTIYVDDFSLS